MHESITDFAQCSLSVYAIRQNLRPLRTVIRCPDFFRRTHQDAGCRVTQKKASTPTVHLLMQIYAQAQAAAGADPQRKLGYSVFYSAGVVGGPTSKGGTSLMTPSNPAHDAQDRTYSVRRSVDLLPILYVSRFVGAVLR